MAGTTFANVLTRWRRTTSSDSDRPQRSGTLLRNEIFPTDPFSDSDVSVKSSQYTNNHESRPYPFHIIQAPTEMTTTIRKFSYASVKEDFDEDTPQSFESSLSSSELEEVEWIAWPCSQWCKTKGLCSKHTGGAHNDYVQTRLEGYARSNPKKLEKILDELEKRREAQQLHNLSFASEITRCSAPNADLRLQVWREKVRQPSSRDELEDAVITDDDAEEYSESADSDARYLSSFETLPSEIHDQILSYVQVDHTADPYARPHVDLASCSLVSKAVHDAAVRVMYRHVSIPQSKAFSKFTRSLDADPALGRLVHWLDFSHYSSIGFGRARSTTTRTPWLTPTTLLACLEKLPLLQAFLVHEHVDDELDVNVLSKLFRMPHLQALDFTACSSKTFTESFNTTCALLAWQDANAPHPLQRLSLHECTTLPEQAFETLLPRFGQLTHLDVAHTQITDKALFSIPHTAKITHLNLERCTKLTGSAVVKFLTTHPAVKDSLIYLNLMADASRHRLLSDIEVTNVLQRLPTTLRSLNIGGALVDSSHVPALQRLATHLEELGLKGADLGLSSDINRIFGLKDRDDDDFVDPSYSTSLRYIDLTDVKSVTQMSLLYSPTALTSNYTQPLEVIEVGSTIVDELKRRNMRMKDPEWVVRELGRRGWYARQPTPQQTASGETKQIDDGSRPWKMGARWWGMRKVPVVNQDVGGMYGYFMFKRN